MKRSYSKVKEIVMKQILLAGDLKEFKINDDLTVYADSLDLDMVVFDVDNNPLANQEFTFENKVIKTGENGEILSIEDVVADAVTEEVQAADEVAVEAPATGDANAELETAKKRIEELEVENQALKAELATLQEEAVQLAAQPATKGINLSDVKIEDTTPKVITPKSRIGKAFENKKNNN